MGNNIIELSKNCSGCGLCTFVCPKKCISLCEGKHHFIYPQVSDECVNCGLCFSKCPQNLKSKELSRKSFLYINDNSFDLLNSTSGGAIIKLARYIIKLNGVVYGAAWCDNLQVKHIRIDKNEDVSRIQKSKYVQSLINSDIYRLIKDDVDSNKLVLFTGTPCQCAAVYALFSKKPSNLILCDILCHGVPNQWSFDQSARAFEKVEKGKIIDFTFRYKEKGSDFNKRFKLTLNKNNKLIQYNAKYDYFPFYKAFHSYSIYRESCNNCLYRDSNRFSDVTFGDFWGVANLNCKFTNGFNKSLIISNNDFGNEIIRNCFGTLEEYDFNESIAHNKGYSFNPSKVDYSFYDKCENILTLEKEIKLNNKKIKRNKFKNKIKRILNKFGFRYFINIIDYKRTNNFEIFDLKKMQMIIEDIFKNVISICDRHQIKYYCQAGTVLGAIRHSRSIPWDYDVDIIVPNNQIEKLCLILDKELPNKYYVDFFKINPSSKRQFPRIGLKGFSTDTLHLDIFRLVGLPDDRKEQIRLVKKFNNLTLKVVSSRKTNKVLLKERKINLIFAKLFFGKKHYLKRFDKLANKYDYDSSIWVMNPSGKYKEKNIFKKEIYGDGRLVKYSDFKVIVPSETDFYLKQYYGDYMKTPSEEYVNKMLSELFKIS